MKHIKNFESFLNEGSWTLGTHYRQRTPAENAKLGRTVKTFSMAVPEWQYFNVANTHPEYGPLSKDWQDALKELGVKEEEAGVVFPSILLRQGAVPSMDYITIQADKAKLDYIEVNDMDGFGEDGIIFSIKK